MKTTPNPPGRVSPLSNNNLRKLPSNLNKMIRNSESKNFSKYSVPNNFNEETIMEELNNFNENTIMAEPPAPKKDFRSFIEILVQERQKPIKESKWLKFINTNWRDVYLPFLFGLETIIKER